MSVSARTIVPSERAPSTIFVGLDVHKESVTLAVLPADASAPVRVDTLPYDLRKLRRYPEKLGPADTLRTCYEASGAEYVLQRELAAWGITCTVIAPSLIPTKPGVQRKDDKYDASQLACPFRAGELTAVHIPTEAEERVRDLVRCRSTFQREILKSRHYVLKLLAGRELVYREGTPWRQPHYEWLRRLARADPDMRKRDERLADRTHHTPAPDPLHDKSRPAPPTVSVFAPSDFTYDAVARTCVCPAGKSLYRKGASNVTNGYVGEHFRGAKCDCVPCALHAACLRTAETTQVRNVAFFRERVPVETTRPPTDTHTTRMQQRLDTPAGRAQYGRRFATVEPVFANLRFNKRLDRFTLRSRTKVNGQWLLFCLVHNIEKLSHAGYAG